MYSNTELQEKYKNCIMNISLKEFPPVVVYKIKLLITCGINDLAIIYDSSASLVLFKFL